MKICSVCKQKKFKIEFSKNCRTKDGLQCECKVCRSEAKKKYRAENKDKIIESNRRYRQRNKHKRRFNERCRKRKIKSSIPSWADYLQMQAYYDVCKFFNEVNGFIKYHVDHIIPINGKNVCGLHVHNNLQVIPALDNIRKSNKYE